MQIKREELLSHQEYGKVCDRFLKEVIAEKKKRRVKVSEHMSAVFENKLTVWYQIQEMIHAEKIEQEEYIQEMLEVYNELLPFDNELAMTFFIEISDKEKLRAFNKTLIGINEKVKIEFGGHAVSSYEPDSDDGDEEKGYTQSVHYLHFPFNEEQKAAFLSYQGPVQLHVDHENYSCQVELIEELVDDLKKELS